MAEVVVVGAGPVGLALACELARHGVRCRLVEARPLPLPYCRAIGITPRTLEIYEDMGIARAMIDAGLWLTGVRMELAGIGTKDVMEDFSDLPFAALGVPQGETERLLAAHLSDFGVRVERGVRLVSLAQVGEKVRVELEGPDGAEVDHARYVVGCDGAHSAVRHLLGIPFEGEAWPMSFMLGDVNLTWPDDHALPRGMALRAVKMQGPDAPPDLFVAIPLPEHGRYRVSMLAPAAPGSAETVSGVAHGIQSEQAGPTVPEIQAVADRLMARPPGVSDLRWSSRFRISMRLAARYRQGQVFIAGDAAHIHPPTGGQGMNTGIQDAYNLAWKMALVLHGHAAPALLDSYEAERRPVAADVIARTVAESLSLDRARPADDRLVRSQIAVSYRGSAIVADGQPDARLAAGDRMPDAAGLRRQGIGFPLRLFDLLRGTEHVLLCPVADAGGLRALEQEAAALAALLPLRVIAIAPAERDGAPDLPDPFAVALVRDAGSVIAGLCGTDAVLVRPDGYIAWVGAPSDAAGRAAVLARVTGAVRGP